MYLHAKNKPATLNHKINIFDAKFKPKWRRLIYDLFGAVREWSKHELRERHFRKKVFMAVKVISTFHRCRCRNRYRNRARMNIKHSGSDSFTNIHEADRMKESSDLGFI